MRRCATALSHLLLLLAGVPISFRFIDLSYKFSCLIFKKLISFCCGVLHIIWSYVSLFSLFMMPWHISGTRPLLICAIPFQSVWHHTFWVLMALLCHSSIAVNLAVLGTIRVVGLFFFLYANRVCVSPLQQLVLPGSLSCTEQVTNFQSRREWEWSSRVRALSFPKQHLQKRTCFPFSVNTYFTSI